MNELDIQHVIEEFCFHCQYEKNLSDKTLKAYKIDLKQFVSYCVDNNISYLINEIDKNTIKGYLKFISEKYKPKTIKRKVATLKSLFSYLEFEDIIVVNPFRKIKISIKQGKQVPRTIEISIIQRLFQYLYSLKLEGTNKESYSYRARLRDIAVLELLFTTGLRVSELCNLKHSDVDLNAASLRITGKGNKERIVPICNAEAIDAISEYYIVFKNQIVEKEFFFINRLSNRLSEQSVRFMIKKYICELNIEENITPHMFRHSIATLLLENEVDIRYIQALLGHSSINTTQIYLQVNQKSQRRILTSKHPRPQLSVI